MDRTGAKLVLSSSWRSCLDYEFQPTDSAMRNILTALGEQGLKLWDKTTLLREERGFEIRRWLGGKKNIESYVILDDESLAEWEDLRSHWVETSYYIGLTEKEAEQAVRILNG